MSSVNVHGICACAAVTDFNGIVAQLADPEGNRITLAEPPPGFVRG